MQTLEEAIAPAELVFALHHGWQGSTAEGRRHLRRRLELALVRCQSANTGFVADVATVWACLRAGATARPTERAPACTPDTGDGDLGQVALAIRSGATGPEQLSYLRYRLCRERAPEMVWACRAPPTSVVGAPEVGRLRQLLTGYARDCIFAGTGDWMIHTRALLVCPAWRTCVTAGGTPPFSVATAVHGSELNDLLRPVIDRPIWEQLAGVEAEDEGPAAFVLVYTLMQELVPGARVAINAGVLEHAGATLPVPFTLQGFDLPGVVRGDCHGLLIGEALAVFNGRGVFAAAAAWVYIMRLMGSDAVADVAGFVLDGDAISDGNPLLKYRS